MSPSTLRRAALAALTTFLVVSEPASSRAAEPAGSALGPAAPSPSSGPPAPPAAAEPLPAPEPQGVAPATDNAAPRSWLVQGSDADAGAPSEAAGGSTGLTVGAVLLLLALGAAAVVMRYKRQKLSPLGPSESRLTVLSSSRLGPKAFAVTAHVNGRVLLLGVTDHTVSNLGWLDARSSEPAAEGQRAESEDDAQEEDELPDDYPGSALRASRVPPSFASSSNLKRFQEVLRGAEASRADLPLRPSYRASPVDAASLLAAQTSDVVAAPTTNLKPSPVSLRRKRRGRENLAAHEPARPAAGAAQKSTDAGLEGQVAGLRALRNGG